MKAPLDCITICSYTTIVKRDAMPCMIAMMGRRSADLSPEAVELVAARFRTLGEPLQMVGSTQPNVSKHLRILQEAGIVGRRQEGNSVYCYIADRSVFDLCNAVCDSLENHFSEAARMAAELGRG